MTRNRQTETGFGFTAKMARADFTSFTRWYDRRCLLARPTLAECEASLGQPSDAASETAPMRDAA